MIVNEHKIRVRYEETDRMTYVYNGNYAVYFEIGRTELIREIGISYRDMETKMGVMLPLRKLHMEYKKPAFYDDILTIRSFVKQLPEVRFDIEHEIYNEKNELITKGYVQLIFVNAETMKPMRAPDFFIKALKKNWKE